MSAGDLRLADAAATARLGRALAGRLAGGDTVLLEGGLGAGKTSFARAALAGLGLAGEAPSPSFALVIDYRPPELRLPVRHVDLYRLERRDELDELGLDERDAGDVLLVEWPERAGPGAWPDALRLALAPDGVGRRLTWTAPPAWEPRWPPPLP